MFFCNNVYANKALLCNNCPTQQQAKNIVDPLTSPEANDELELELFIILYYRIKPVKFSAN